MKWVQIKDREEAGMFFFFKLYWLANRVIHFFGASGFQQFILLILFLQLFNFYNNS